MKPLAIIIALTALALGVLFEDTHYRLREHSQASDQAMLDHRDSSYTSMTWVGSRSDNYLQLRFFDKVEGGLCLRPTWAELNEMAVKDPRLAHLRFKTVDGGRAPAPTWPGETPDPGTLPNSPYVRFFPAGVLLNDALLAKAGGDYRKADPHVLVIGLGSSAGILVLAHHFPQASITVVDIDQKVIDIVTDHVPVTRWLLSQKTADGSPRLRLVAKDARQFVRFDAPRQERPFDLVILDAYTAGSTIPSHLMTREFFADCATALSPDGLVLGNIIGSYTGEKHQVVGGALRSLRAAGLTEAYNIPVISWMQESPATLNTKQARNNIVLASHRQIDPRHHAAAWQRMLEFEPFPELPTGTYVSTQYALLDKDQKLITSFLPGEAVDANDPSLRMQLKAGESTPGAPQYMTAAMSDAPSVIDSVRRDAAAWYSEHKEKDRLVGPPAGWAGSADEAKYVWRRETDWVKAAREVWRVSLIAAKDATLHSGEALVGPLEGKERDDAAPTWGIADAPLFTDQMPNADIVNH